MPPRKVKRKIESYPAVIDVGAPIDVAIPSIDGLLTEMVTPATPTVKSAKVIDPVVNSIKKKYRLLRKEVTADAAARREALNQEEKYELLKHKFDLKPVYRGSGKKRVAIDYDTYKAEYDARRAKNASDLQKAVNAWKRMNPRQPVPDDVKRYPAKFLREYNALKKESAALRRNQRK